LLNIDNKICSLPI